MIQGILHDWNTTLTPLNYISLTCLNNFCSGSLSLKWELENWGEISCLRMLVWGERGILLNLIICSHFNQRVHMKAETFVTTADH